MSELARTPPQLKDLFRLIDLAPQPHDRVVGQGLAAWHERRGDALAPQAADITRDVTDSIAANSFVAAPRQGNADFDLASIGGNARTLLGLAASAGRLTTASDHRFAVRLRRLFTAALERGEPILGAFVDEDASGANDIEVLAAPILLGDGHLGIFCTMSRERLG